MAEFNHEKDSLQIDVSDKKGNKKHEFKSGEEFLEYERNAAEKRRGDIIHSAMSAKKKKIPVWADLLISLLIIAAIAGIIWGAVMLFDMYISDYEEKIVEYTLITDECPVDIKKNSSIFCEPEGGNGNVVYMGKVQSKRTLEDGRVLIVVRLSVKYRPAEGYMNGEYRIAVGTNYKIKFGDTSFDSAIVELAELK